MNETGLWIMLSTLLPLVVYPLTLCLGFSILGLVLMLFRRRTVGAVLVLCGFSILFMAASPMTGNWLYGSLERQFATQPIDQFPKADVIVLLGGVLRLPLPPRTDFELT
ncbi:MAG TPA: YdcF family protein, partial [Gammaproteobacteria bacterium]|nr:YdcF family protein [Gammaproteobacteria bacterium]